MRQTKTTPALRKNHGFSLVEVLIAMLVMSIGLLGLAALQAQGLKFNHDAYGRTQGTALAYDIMDRMRANRANAADYVVADPNEACDATVADADMDLSCWYDNLAALLPSGTGGIAQNAVDATMYDVTVQWSDRETSVQADCVALNRTWDAGNNICLVTQVWVVLP